MARPSRNLDRALLAAGRVLLPAHGCAALSIRQVAEAAGVNIGMFHYHFRTREAFLRAVLQQAYEEMFATLTLEVSRERVDTGDVERACTENLRLALRVLGRFARDNRELITRILADALAGEPVAREFLRDNLPRHLRILLALIRAGQLQGELRAMAPTQALGFCAGALAMPVLFGGAIAHSEAVPKAVKKELSRALLADAALDERIDLALAALAAPAPPATPVPAQRARKKNGGRP
jgi:AcrR family transcriptional regulator